jgi:hypothetical protein
VKGYSPGDRPRGKDLAARVLSSFMQAMESVGGYAPHPLGAAPRLAPSVRHGSAIPRSCMLAESSSSCADVVVVPPPATTIVTGAVALEVA